MNPRKHRVAGAFAAAADGYDAAAEVQRRVALRLAEMVAVRPPVPGLRVEIGCGTGLLTGPLLDRVPGEWLVTDIAPAMIERCAARVGRHRATFRVMDGEAPDLPRGGCGFIVSSLAFQWFEDLGAALARLAACLAPGGRLDFATLGVDTFQEWRAAHAALGLSCGVPAFPSGEGLAALWPAGGQGTWCEDHLRVRHADGRAFAQGLKALGAHLAAPGHEPLPAGSLRRVLCRLEGGCDATYHVLYGSWIRSPA